MIPKKLKHEQVISPSLALQSLTAYHQNVIKLIGVCEMLKEHLPPNLQDTFDKNIKDVTQFIYNGQTEQP